MEKAISRRRKTRLVDGELSPHLAPAVSRSHTNLKDPDHGLGSRYFVWERLSRADDGYTGQMESCQDVSCRRGFQTPWPGLGVRNTAVAAVSPCEMSALEPLTNMSEAARFRDENAGLDLLAPCARLDLIDGLAPAGISRPQADYNDEVGGHVSDLEVSLEFHWRLRTGRHSLVSRTFVSSSPLCSFLFNLTLLSA